MTSSIFTRVSVRRYEDRPVEQEKTDYLLKAAMQAPSAGDQQPWEFYVIKNPIILAKLARISEYSGAVGRAPIAILSVMRTEGLPFQPVAPVDMSICMENMWLACSEVGLGGVWIGVAPFEDRIAKTGKKPKAIVPVYLYGMPAKIEEIMAIADRYDIPVIEDAAEGLGSRYDGQVCGTFGRYGVLSFNGNKMITTSGGGALICPDEETKKKIMFYATQARESYPYYQHEEIGYNYRMSNICAGIGRGQMTVLDEHIAHHQHTCQLYKELLAGVEGIVLHENPSSRFDSNYWLNTILLDPSLHVKGEEHAYETAVQGAVGGAAGVTHVASSLHTDSEPNRNVEAMRMALDAVGIESRPLWKPMHLQPVYKNNPRYVNGVSESLFKQGLCLPSGPCVTDEDVAYIVQEIKNSVKK